MPQNTLDEIVFKYAAMNKAHPFMEGNSRSTRIWLDLMLKKRLKKCVNWCKISKENYMNAMIISTVDSSILMQLLETALTNKINDREMFMKGIDYSYYYEE
jgi:cell filamentation protein